MDVAAKNGNFFKCVACRQSGLRSEADAYRCDGCGARYPVILGVPLLLKGLQVRPSCFSLPPDAVALISDYLYDKPGGEDWARFLGEVFSYRYEFADLTLGAENNYFFNRIPVLKDLARPPLRTEA